MWMDGWMDGVWRRGGKAAPVDEEDCEGRGAEREERKDDVEELDDLLGALG